MQGFEEIYATYFRKVYRFVLSACRDADMAEEATQRAFWNAYKHYADFQGRSDVTTWLCRIAKNEYLSIPRKRKPERSCEQIENTPAPGSVEDNLTDRQQTEALQKYVHELDEPYKEVFLLRVYGEISFARSAALFSKSEGWARVTFYRAKLRIQERLEREDAHGEQGL